MTINHGLSTLWRSCCGAPDARPHCRRIDRSMIGTPTNFRHIGHIGSEDLADGRTDHPVSPSPYATHNVSVKAMEDEMGSKGGYHSPQFGGGSHYPAASGLNS